ncbi:hypothetical protein DEU56DRAFT_342515 [Suillus clintonianus]|uniref:uncharacterized protein n=1 Tax=Suillus clintonianus TaxID=1904413 RepID=UPI001B85EC68|nr:uncharacterized protein DEU56DRAFT_342515 [Suillus clintonianus]KAG2137910.1 hypothetical protein DEU56DRAFT_342515 [Suillus clintonianus]
MEHKCAFNLCTAMVPSIQEGQNAPMLHGEPICDHCDSLLKLPIPKSKNPIPVEPQTPEQDTRCNEIAYRGDHFEYPAHLPLPWEGQITTRSLIPWKAGETKWKWKYGHRSVEPEAETKGRSPRTTLIRLKETKDRSLRTPLIRLKETKDRGLRTTLIRLKNSFNL